MTAPERLRVLGEVEPDNLAVLHQLNRVKVLFQARTIAALMSVTPPVRLSTAALSERGS